MPSVGEVLRLERERQGRTLKEVSDALNIKQEYLAALEAEKYDVIPGVVFVKGFIRNYGNYLELDGNVLVDEYKNFLASSSPKPEVRTVAPAHKVKIKHKSIKKRNRNGRWPEITIIAGIILFLLLILWIMM